MFQFETRGYQYQNLLTLIIDILSAYLNSGDKGNFHALESNRAELQDFYCRSGIQSRLLPRQPVDVGDPRHFIQV